MQNDLEQLILFLVMSSGSIWTDCCWDTSSPRCSIQTQTCRLSAPGRLFCRPCVLTTRLLQQKARQAQQACDTHPPANSRVPAPIMGECRVALKALAGTYKPLLQASYLRLMCRPTPPGPFEEPGESRASRACSTCALRRSPGKHAAEERH